MSPLATLPRRTWLERTVLGLAVAVMVIGGLSLAGWWLHMDWLLQPFGPQATLKANAALGFVALGIALLGLELRRRGLAALAGIGALIGVLSLAQDVFSLELKIDQLLTRDRLPDFTEFPGRMSAMLAICLILAGSTLLWKAAARASRPRIFTEAVAGAALLSAGLSTLLGYATELADIYTWWTNTATPPVAAGALCLLGTALLGIAWRDHVANEGDTPRWVAVPPMMIGLTLTLILWHGLGIREANFMSGITVSQMDQFALQIRDVFEKQTGQVERVARAWAEEPANAERTWEADASLQMLELGAGEFGCRAIAYVDRDYRTIWAYPPAAKEALRGFPQAEAEERRQALDLAATTRGPALSTTTAVFAMDRSGGKGVVIYCPILRAGAIAGFVAAEFEYQKLFHQIVTSRVPQLGEKYHVAVFIGGERVYRFAETADAAEEEHAVERVYTIASRRIRIFLTPTVATLRETRRALPLLALGAGIGITVLLGLSVHLGERARAGLRAAELSNRRLFAENEERRRIEARLKVSDERLRLALDATHIGIFEWNVASGHTYFSPGLWAMLGYDPARMPSTAEAWHTLIHPHDFPAYRRRQDEQLAGQASFIDPEYRVRTHDGNWRWIYERAKSVATDASGRPTRIVGTVQDITARRETEQALRESQAEARQLSLVAAKTDNPVLIGSPDGRIEWANEAFCRVMEYSLDEVRGKNPAQLLVGPGTSPRTVTRIRAALARGKSVSTDVVTYSQFGRRYHLHLEAQPVLGAQGELENFIAVMTDITARVETEHQLRRAKQEADEASRAKSSFLAAMSHEIRTPMNGVIGMTSLLMETSLTSEQRDFVHTIRTSGEALLTIINDILDFSKIESGRMEIERAPFHLPLCVEEALDLFALQTSAKRLEFGYLMDPDTPTWIVGDVTRLRQVLINLVNNAVKFTPQGSVSVEIRRAGGLVPPDQGRESPASPSPMVLEFRVTDTGIGIPADRLDRLFKAFSQVDSSTTRKYGGTGLGLAICQRLCKLMGGDIRLESTSGRGTTFVFTVQTEPATGQKEDELPVLPPALRAGGAVCVEPHPVTGARVQSLFRRWGAACTVVPGAAEAMAAAGRHWPALLVVDTGEVDSVSPLEALTEIRCPRLLLYRFGQVAPARGSGSLPTASMAKPIRTNAFFQAVAGLFEVRPAEAAAAAPVAKRPLAGEIPLRILLAEDNAVNQKVAVRFLQYLGYRADAVANGREAVTAAESRPYDLVFMDVQMPEMDGYEATQLIRARLPADRQPKIIALTASAMQEDRVQALAAGMDDYLSKPVKIDDLASTIRRHFGATRESAAVAKAAP